MSRLAVDLELLQRFEQALDPLRPERSGVPGRVIGYGEISTVLELGGGMPSNLAFKRVPMFQSVAEVERYEALYREYIQTLQERVGVQVVPSDIVRVEDERRKRIVVYIIQEKLPSEAICSQAIRRLSPDETQRLVLAILEQTARVFGFNQENKGVLELGFDGQISNWALVHFDPQKAGLDDEIKLLYLDTSSPLISKGGNEQMDPELFLRSAPSFLVWILRWLFLQDVMTRYYDFRKVSIDLIANFYKEQQPGLVPATVETANQFFAEKIQVGEFKPLSVEEIQSYYREDAWIWRFYLAFRKVDRSLHGLVGKYYPYILPEKIKR